MSTVDYGQVIRSDQSPQEVDYGSSADDDDGSVHSRIGGIDGGHLWQVVVVGSYKDTGEGGQVHNGIDGIDGGHHRQVVGVGS